MRAFGDAISFASPSGKMSNRARKAAQERIRVDIFGKEGLQRPIMAQPSEKESLLRRAKQLRELASRGMKPRAYIKEAERLEALAKK